MVGALVVVAAEVATIVDLGGLVGGATVSVDSVSAAVDVTGAVLAIEVLDGGVDNTTVVESSWGLSAVALPFSRALMSSASVSTPKKMAVAARSFVQRGTCDLGRGAVIAD